MVNCPFPHKNADGSTYLESRPSAGLNLTKRLIHCLSCKTAYSEAQFITKIHKVSYAEALQMLGMEAREVESNWLKFHNSLKESKPTVDLVKSLGLYDAIDLLQLGYKGDGIAFPVFVYGDILDIRTYSPHREPKVKSESKAKNLILPFDLWVNDPRPTLLCAGEKDMAIARVNGFNAITFTGGENSFPKLFKGSFKGKTVYIVYDHDNAGQEGAAQTAMQIKEAGGYPYVVTGHYATCTEKGEDVHDFFQKYGKTKADLALIINGTDPFTEAEFTKVRNVAYPLVNLLEATKGEFANNRLISSRVTVIANYEEVFHIPEYVTFEKTEHDEKSIYKKGDVIEWVIGEDNLKDILLLCDSNLKETDVHKNLKQLCYIPAKEEHMKMVIRSKTNVFKSIVTDHYEKEVLDKNSGSHELTLYSLQNPLTNGEKYRIFYKPFAHPLQGMKVVGIAARVEESDHSLNQFVVTEAVLSSLACFQGDPKVKMEEFYERSKSFCGVETRKEIYYTLDLFYHTPLQMKFGNREIERAYLEPMLIGESSTGKSQVAKGMLNMIELGMFTSFKTSTIAGLIGGSDKTNGGYKTKLGLIPRNHKGAIIIEEFSDNGKEFIKQLTDIRSSNQVRIVRVNGETTAPAMVRMLTISNQPKQSNGQVISLRQYPNGIKVLIDLIGAAEDIRRYDFFILVDNPDEYTYPNTKITAEAFPKESYMNRARWIWSRKPEQIIIDEPIQDYIIEVAQNMNKIYNSHIQLFGAEAWKKLARLAIAVAACVCSMDDTGEKLIVKMEHVAWAKNFLIACYDNPLFKLREFVTYGRQYTECTPAAINALQGLYDIHPTLISQMENMTEISQQQLRSISGLGNDDFNKVVNRLAECHFFLWNGDKMIPSERFRTALGKISKEKYMTKVGAQ